MIRMSTDQLGGITYTYPNVTAFLANTPTQVQYFGDLSEPSPFHNGASGHKNIAQEYYVAYAQDEWRLRPNLTLNYGLRYDYYVPLREVDNRIVKFNIDTGVLDPDTTPLYQSKKTNFQPRLSMTFSPSSKTVFRAGGGIFVGPGQTEDQIQPVEAERISSTVSSGALNAYPGNPAADSCELHQQPEQSGVPAASVRQRVHAAREGVSVHRLGAAGAGGEHGGDGRLRRRARAETSSCEALPTGRSACSRTERSPRRRFANSTS